MADLGYKWPALAQQAFMEGTCRAGLSIVRRVARPLPLPPLRPDHSSCFLPAGRVVHVQGGRHVLWWCVRRASRSDRADLASARSHLSQRTHNRSVLPLLSSRLGSRANSLGARRARDHHGVRSGTRFSLSERCRCSSLTVQVPRSRSFTAGTFVGREPRSANHGAPVTQKVDRCAVSRSSTCCCASSGRAKVSPVPSRARPLANRLTRLRALSAPYNLMVQVGLVSDPRKTSA